MGHEIDESKISNILIVSELKMLDMYLAMQTRTVCCAWYDVTGSSLTSCSSGWQAYSSSWKAVTNRILSLLFPIVLANAVATIRCLVEGASLSKANSTKIPELADELSNSLRDSVAGRDEGEVASFRGSELLSHIWLPHLVSRTRWSEDYGGGKQDNAHDIVSALSERDRPEYEEERVCSLHRTLCGCMLRSDT